MSILAVLSSVSLAMSCQAVDGDTLRCGRERVRLTGIDAPEMPGHCERWRKCAPGDPHRSKAAIAIAIKDQPLRLERLATDHYGRTLAVVYADGVNLACMQLAQGNAIYKPRWDTHGRIGKECR